MMESKAARSGLRISALTLLIVFAVPHLRGQVFEVNGGSSSLYQAQGATISARGPSYDASLGAGIVSGQLVGGANLTGKMGHSTYVAGSDYIHFVLPTDIFDSSDYLVALGAGITTKIGNTDIFAFGGATSSEFESPFVDGVRAEEPAGILFLKRRIGPSLQLSSDMVFSQQVTAIQSLQWQPAAKTDFALSGGVGANQPYGAASFDFLRPWIDVKAAYIEAGSNFRRVAVAAPLFSEPNRENAIVTLRPSKYFTVSGGRQNFLSPVTNSTSSVQSSVDEGSGNIFVARTNVSASLYHSNYQGTWNNATAYTIGRSLLPFLQASSSYLESRPNNTPKIRDFLANFNEKVNPRLNVSEMVSRSQGQTTVSFGGGFLSNVASITAGYQTFYIPQRNSNPFEQALILDVQLHVIHGLTLHGATFVAPDGSLQYTADSQAVMTRQGAWGAPGGGEKLAQGAIGSSIIRGRVVDASGRPVSGAALMIDKLLVYTDDDGVFFVRERKPHTHVLKVMPAQFLGGAAWNVVSAPENVRSSGKDNAPEIVIVVERVTLSRK